ncbi:sugar phosphate isomerase/epimerase [Caulobacter segnis]|uniref:sugar phosphate isomerase/epimerase family protein n=1 Tax=Caulobacter segnis TaxID=88688 RepID=UPI0024105724|nr:sugar phosphate isomerase/epimerase [Caulobacter segnis]MDG2520770.1 sugar phosphate isomerase/epimerase [Caulobacter segnis]
MLSRRSLLAAGMAAVATPALATRSPWPLGVQLWTAHAQLAADFEATLRSIAEIGYRRVEAAGLHGRTPDTFRKALEAAGLSCDSAHVSMPDLRDDPDRAICVARDLGARYLVCSSPAPVRPLQKGIDWNTALARAMTLDDWKHNADLLNRFGARAAKAGLRLGYHNHLAEAGLYEGVRAYDLLLERTQPDLVCMQLDVAWAAAGGLDPVTLLQKHGARIALLHLKDLAVKQDPGRSLTTVELGRGTIDWSAVIPAAKAAGVRAAFVEQEAPFARPVLESLRISRDFLSGA